MIFSRRFSTLILTTISSSVRGQKTWPTNRTWWSDGCLTRHWSNVAIANWVTLSKRPKAALSRKSNLKSFGTTLTMTTFDQLNFFDELDIFAWTALLGTFQQGSQSLARIIWIDQSQCNFEFHITLISILFSINDWPIQTVQRFRTLHSKIQLPHLLTNKFEKGFARKKIVWF